MSPVGAPGAHLSRGLMPARPTIPYTGFSAVNHEAAERIAANPKLRLETRIEKLAVARMTVYGHAYFPQGTLERLLCDENGTPANDSGVRKAIINLKAADILAPVSTRRCLVPNADLYFRAAGSSARCGEASHAAHLFERYSNGHGRWFFYLEGYEVTPEGVVHLETAELVTARSKLERLPFQTGTDRVA